MILAQLMDSRKSTGVPSLQDVEGLLLHLVYILPKNHGAVVVGIDERPHGGSEPGGQLSLTCLTSYI